MDSPNFRQLVDVACPLVQVVFVLVAMFLLFAAMISEVFKAAYLAIPKVRWRSGSEYRLTPAQTIWRIVLPQAFRGSSKYDRCHP